MGGMHCCGCCVEQVRRVCSTSCRWGSQLSQAEVISNAPGLEDLLHRPPARLTLLLAGRVVGLGSQSQADVAAVVAWLAALSPTLRLRLSHNLLLLRKGRCLLGCCALAVRRAEWLPREAVLQEAG